MPPSRQTSRLEDEQLDALSRRTDISLQSECKRINVFSTPNAVPIKTPVPKDSRINERKAQHRTRHQYG
jgi:hypothetical protein